MLRKAEEKTETINRQLQKLVREASEEIQGKLHDLYTSNISTGYENHRFTTSRFT